MDYLTNLYKNKAEALSEQVKILEAKLKALNEASATKDASLGAKTAQELKQEFIDPVGKWAKRAASPIKTTKAAAEKTTEVAKSVAKGTKDVAAGTVKTAKGLVTTPSTEIPELLAKGAEVGKKVASVAGPLAVGYWTAEGAEELADIGLKASGVEDPLTKAAVKGGVGFGAFSGAATTTSALLSGQALGAATTSGLAAAAPAAVAGAALPVVAYGAYKAGEAIGEKTGLHDYLAKQLSGQAESEKPVTKFPTVAELQAKSKAEREAKEEEKKKQQEEIDVIRKKAAERRAARPEGTKFD